MICFRVITPIARRSAARQPSEAAARWFPRVRRVDTNSIRLRGADARIEDPGWGLPSRPRIREAHQPAGWSPPVLRSAMPNTLRASALPPVALQGVIALSCGCPFTAFLRIFARKGRIPRNEPQRGSVRRRGSSACRAVVQGRTIPPKASARNGPLRIPKPISAMAQSTAIAPLDRPNVAGLASGGEAKYIGAMTRA